MTFILRTITDTGTSDDDTDCPIDIFDQTLSTFDEGSDEWIRCHFKNYILHLMRCSFLDGWCFNSFFSQTQISFFLSQTQAASTVVSILTLWPLGRRHTTTRCGRMGQPLPPVFVTSMPSIPSPVIVLVILNLKSPSKSNLLLEYLLKLSLSLFLFASFFANQQESLNQTFNNASKVVLTNAKSTVNSWFTNLSTTIQPRRMLTRTAQIIGQVTTGTSGQPESVPPDEEETSV